MTTPVLSTIVIVGGVAGGASAAISHTHTPVLTKR